jgi:glycosyltransferase involved in cell wall biosynthesis
MFSPDQRLLFFSHLIALPRHHGGCVYPHALLTALHQRGVKIDYAWLGSPLAGGRRLMHDPLDADFIHRGWVRGARRFGGFLVPELPAAFFSPRGTPVSGVETSEHLATEAEQIFAADVIRRSGATAILIDGTATLTILDRLTPDERARLHVGVLTHNLNSRRTDLYRAHGQPFDFLPMTAEEETALLARADTIVAIQEREAESFRTMLPEHAVVTVPMPITPGPAVRDGRMRPCLFVGGYSGHNLAALHWLLTDIWPLVRAAEPTAELIVAGTVGQATGAVPAGVHVIGAVADLKNLYAETCISLVPLPMGTGLKIKLVEAMGHGNAVVTTSAGAEGFAELESGEIAVVADEALSFAAAIVKLLWRSSWRESVALRQLNWVKRTLAPDVVIAPLAALWSAAPAPLARR